MLCAPHDGATTLASGVCLLPIWVMVALVVLINLPFGYWRAAVRKFSLQWALAIHIPVLLAIAIRVLHEIPFEPVTVAFTTMALFVGQTAGQKSREALASVLPVPLSSCIFIDLVRAALA